METKFDEYTQGLYDTVLSLRKEVDNLTKAYDIVHKRIDAISSQASVNSSASLKEAVDIEELARLSVVASEVAHKAARALLDASLIIKTKQSLDATTNTYSLSVENTKANASRQKMGGGRLKAI
jgi:hypothetical protein